MTLSQTLLSLTQKNILDQLLQCRIRCHGTCYLMGLPDPTQSLASNEIFVPGWCSCNCRSSAESISREYQFDVSAPIPHIECISSAEVLVSRFPLHSPDGIRKMKLINDCYACSERADLIRYFNPTGQFVSKESGVIIFGSNPALVPQTSSPVVSAMGGDYDGDLYWVCTDDRLVQSYSPRSENLSPLMSGEQREEIAIPQLLQPLGNLDDEFLDPPLIHTNILTSRSRTISVDSCQYLRVLSLPYENIQSISLDGLMEALLWEGLTPFSAKHLSLGDTLCHHEQANKFLKLLTTTSGVAR